MTPTRRLRPPLVLALVSILLASLPAAAQTGIQPIGPAGAAGGTPFADRCAIAAVVVNAGWWIDGIQVLCRDGVHHAWRGGTGGGRHRFDLQPGERIVAVSGWTQGNSGNRVYGLEIHTDRRSSGMFGNAGTDRGRNPFRLEVPQGWELHGISGYADASALNGIGLEVVRPPATARIGPVGAAGGTPFADSCPVVGVIVNAGWWIDGIQLVCAGGRTGPQRGGTGGSRQTFMIPPGARITAISGTVDGSYGDRVYSIQVHTDRGSSPRYGGAGPDGGRTPFVLSVPEGFSLAGVFGGASDALLSLGIEVVRGAGR